MSDIYIYIYIYIYILCQSVLFTWADSPEGATQCIASIQSFSQIPRFLVCFLCPTHVNAYHQVSQVSSFQQTCYFTMSMKEYFQLYVYEFRAIQYPNLHYFQRYAFANKKPLIFVTLLPFMVTVFFWIINIRYEIYI